MSTPTPLFAELAARGLIHQHTPELADHLAQPRTIYCGFDPTAASLHVGSLLPLVTLRRLQLAGHRVILLMGGATGMIGDPSFKATERKLLDEETLRANVAGIQVQVQRLFEGVPPSPLGPTRVRNNYDWTAPVSVLTFLRNIGKLFSVNQMIARESVKTRLEREGEGMSYTEFSYALLQAFDFLHLYQHDGCTVQLGGSDQWGNMTAGTELIRKQARGEAHVLTLPLITKADGSKFGKSESGNVWLDATLTSPYSFYQFWLNTPDADIGRLLHLFSFKPLAEIDALLAAHAADPGARLPQKALAEELTDLLHGPAALASAQRITAALFGKDGAELTESDYAQLALDGLPTQQLTGDATLTDALLLAELAGSKREAREFIGNGVLHNGQSITDPELSLSTANAQFGRYHLLRRGKKNFALLVHAKG